MTNSRFERNLGFVNDQEQEKLANASIAIAGAGGDGGMLAVNLARMGVGEFRLADPDPFEIENINRQAVCTDKTMGSNKAEAVAEYVEAINPEARIDVYTKGITADNTEKFVKGTTLVIDETEFTMHALGVMLAREARGREIPVMTALNIGFGAMVTTFDPSGYKLEKMLGLKEEQNLEEVAAQEVGLDRWLPYLPKYVDLNAFQKVAEGEKSAPSIAPGVSMAAALGTTQAFLNIVGRENNRPSPVYAPKAFVVDAMTQESKQVRFGKLSHYKHLAAVVVNNLLKKVPATSY